VAAKTTYGKTDSRHAIKNPIRLYSFPPNWFSQLASQIHFRWSPSISSRAIIAKSASDLDLNFVALGCCYRHGYFRQRLDNEGFQSYSISIKIFIISDFAKCTAATTTCSSCADSGSPRFFASFGNCAWAGSRYLLDTDPGKQRLKEPMITAELYGAETWKCGCARKSSSDWRVKALGNSRDQTRMWFSYEPNALGTSALRTHSALTLFEKKLDFFNSRASRSRCANVFFTNPHPCPGWQDCRFPLRAR